MTKKTTESARLPRRSSAVANSFAPAPLASNGTVSDTAEDVSEVVPVQGDVVARKRKDVSDGHGGGGEVYDEETVKALLDSLREAGYGKKLDKYKSLKELFKAAVNIAADKYDVIRSPEAWQKKFNRIRKDYSSYISKVKQSGRDGDDEELYNKPDFFDLVHELERGKARHDPPSNIVDCISC
eukprot:IDg2950t1